MRAADRTLTTSTNDLSATAHRIARHTHAAVERADERLAMRIDRLVRIGPAATQRAELRLTDAPPPGSANARGRRPRRRQRSARRRRRTGRHPRPCGADGPRLVDHPASRRHDRAHGRRPRARRRAHHHRRRRCDPQRRPHPHPDRVARRPTRPRTCPRYPPPYPPLRPTRRLPPRIDPCRTTPHRQPPSPAMPPRSTELDSILRELESSDVDVDHLAERVARAAELIQCAARRSPPRSCASRRSPPTSTPWSVPSSPIDRRRDERARRKGVRRAAVACVTMSGTPPPTLRRLAERVDVRLGALLATERERWSELRHRPGATRSRRSPVSCSPAASGCARRSATGASSAPAATTTTRSTRCRRGARADARVRAVPRRRDGRRRQPAGRSRRPTRCRRPTHAGAGWAGESRRFGEGVAILVGDLAFVYADQLMDGRAGRGGPTVERAAHRAQHRPVPRHRRLGAARATDRRRPSASAGYKSGKYTIERPLHLGAAAGRPVASRRAARRSSARYGLPLGDAFQMRDDVMGAFGDADGHRQAGRRRPHRGQADTAAGACGRRTPTPPSVPSSTSSAIPTCRPPTSRASSRRSSTPARLDELEAQITDSPRAPSRRSRPPTSPPSPTQELVALAELRDRRAPT